MLKTRFWILQPIIFAYFKCDDEKEDLMLKDDTGNFNAMFKDVQEVQTDEYEFVSEDISGFDYVITSTSIQFASTNTLHVYPNPAHSLINIEGAIGSVKLVDMTGATVYESEAYGATYE